MRTQIQRWGNSLAVRIPKAFAVEAGLEEHSPVDLFLSDGKVVIEPALPEAYSLDQLLAGVTDANLHGEFETGAAVGRESW